MAIRFGSRIFQPSALMSLMALVAIAGLISLGRWQLHRATEKRALYLAFAAGTDSLRVLDAGTPPLPRYQHVRATGHYDSTHQVLIDNMSNAEDQAGYYVITPFDLSGGGWVLVNRGWVPLGPSRAHTPKVEVPSNVREIHGRTDQLPRAGMQLGDRMALAPPYPVVANFPTREEIATLMHETDWTRAAPVVLLDAAEPDGYLREWRPPGFPPIRHIAYAVQWFGLAAALAVIWVVTNLRRAPGAPAAASSAERPS
ncbi:MAG TPA: SURF1 family protein [Steroidobacteraceae bacterium]|nr:SURF1 family protein [Steroidobacteraceae bacterium]